MNRNFHVDEISIENDEQQSIYGYIQILLCFFFFFRFTPDGTVVYKRFRAKRNDADGKIYELIRCFRPARAIAGCG